MSAQRNSSEETGIASKYDLKKVALIGRPNVGKSSLFNLLTESRKSVVKNQPGVTRDLVIETCDVWGKKFDLIDTGGLTESQEGFYQMVREHVVEFLTTVDFLIVMVDGRVGLVPEDRDLFKIARQTGKPFLVVVNKIDQEQDMESFKAEFYEFGQEVAGVSVEQRKNISQILEWLDKNIQQTASLPREGLHLTFVGKPNVGKSSLVNRLLGEKRVLVSEIPGTTVDAIEVPFYFEDKKFVLVDTAGLRRSSRREEDVEIISAFKSQEAIRKSDLVCLVIDIEDGPSEQDAKILSAVLDAHKSVLVVVNKVDLISNEKNDRKKDFEEKLGDTFHFFRDIPFCYVSAKKGFGMEAFLREVQKIDEKIHRHISTSELNEFFYSVIRKAPSPVYATKNVKFYYLTQTKQVPPAFIAFANHPEGVDPAYRRFLINNLKEHFHLEGIPLRLFVMKSRG